MTDQEQPIRAAPISPLHAIFLSFLFPFSLGAMLADWAYSTTYFVQWINFAAWLIVGVLVGGVPALIWSIIGLLMPRSARAGNSVLVTILLAVTVAVTFFNALIHGKDAYATMPGGLILSAIGTVLAFVTTIIAFSGRASWRPQ